MLDSVTLEDWGEEIFTEGVGVKWRKWARGEEEGKKKYIFTPTPALIPPLHQPSNGQASSYNPRSVLRSEKTPALQARFSFVFPIRVLGSTINVG